jgi:hypothetical protein
VEAQCFKELRYGPEVLSLRVPRCPYRLKEFVVTWFRRDGLAFHAGEWLAFALVILLLLALCIALLRLVFAIFKRKRRADESESDYWRMHGG